MKDEIVGKEELTFEESLDNIKKAAIIKYMPVYSKKLVAPEGKEYGWVRTEILNVNHPDNPNRAVYEKDPDNLKRAFGDGWELVRHSPYQELSEDLKELIKSVHISLKDGCFSTKDSILCIRDKREVKENEEFPDFGKIEINGDEIEIWGPKREQSEGSVWQFTGGPVELLYSYKTEDLGKEMPEVDKILNPILEKCDQYRERVKEKYINEMYLHSISLPDGSWIEYETAQKTAQGFVSTESNPDILTKKILETLRFREKDTEEWYRLVKYEEFS